MTAVEQEGRAVHGPVLVTGAGGFLGAALTRRLLRDGLPVRVLVRSAAKVADLGDLGAQVVVGDVTDREAVVRAVAGIQTVYHLAGRLLFPGIPAGEYAKTHVLGTRILLEACRREPQLERFVHCSTTGVLGVTGERAAGESAQQRPTNIYELTKAQAEDAVGDAARAGLPAVIVRPGLVYGPGDMHLLGFFRAVLRRRFRPIGRRPVWLHPIYIGDMTEGFVLCGRHRAALGETFHIAGREPVTLDEFAAVIAAATDTTVPRGHLPMGAARAVAMMSDLLPARLRQASPLTSSRLDFLTHSRVYDTSKARRMLGFAGTTDLTTGVARTVAWYRQHRYLPEGRARAWETAG